MTRYLLDTNVVSELRKPKPHGGVIAWISGLRDEQLYLSAVTMRDLQAGIERTRSQHPEKAREIEAWVDQLQDSYQVLPIDTECFREWGRLMPAYGEELDRPLEDVMIAATARVHTLQLVTRSERDFQRLGIGIINPFKLRS